MGVTLTPLMKGKVQIHKMFKKHNLHALKNELTAFSVVFSHNQKRSKLVELLREDEKNCDPLADTRYFKPVTDFDSFKWLPCHFD
eukprot:8520530-Ditylum_brightwellii.AAC.1